MAVAPLPCVLTVAGSDSGGGAGVQADLKTFEAHRVFGASVITGLTAQNTREVRGVLATPADFVTQQLETVLADLPVEAIKLGMLANAEVVRAVANTLQNYSHLPLVVDPVMVSSTGARLLEEEAVQVLRQELFPLATLISPNLQELQLLTGHSIHTMDDVLAAAQALGETLPEAYILAKGGHLTDQSSTEPEMQEHMARDLLYRQGESQFFQEPYYDTPHTHGTGCTLSAAICANLALGHALPQAVQHAKAYVTDAIRLAPANLGGGHGPLRHNLSAYLPGVYPKPV